MSPEPTPVQFDGGNSWDTVPFVDDWHIGEGWYAPDRSLIIDVADPYWGRILEQARRQYGDPGIHFNTGDVGDQRYLVYGDGATRVPPTVTYRDPSGSMWQQNTDGSSSPISTAGAVGPAQFPAGYVPVDGQYMPVNSRGQQIAPQVSTPMPHGQPYWVDNQGQPRQYFDAAGKPITQGQYNSLINPSAPQDPDSEAPLSGAARDAIANMQEELKSRYNELNSAEQGLSEALLNAAATTDEARRQLAEIQQRIIAAADDPQYDLDTPAGETAYLKFLREQVAEIKALVASGDLASEDSAAITQGLAALYTAEQPAAESETEQQPGATTAAQPGVPADGAVPVESLPAEDYALGPELAMPDPTLSDLGLGTGMGTAPMAGLSSVLPSMLSSLPGMLGGATGSNPLNGLSGLSGLAEPLAGLASGLGDRAEEEPPVDDDESESEDDPVEGEDSDDAEDSPDEQVAEEQPPVQSEPQPGDPEAPDAAPVAEVSAEPLPAPTSVVLPDGSTVTASSPAVAEVMNQHIKDGTPLAEAYRTANIELPPPGTPVVSPISPSALMAGDVGVFKDRLVAALGQDRVFVDGQVQPISVLGSSPDFLGWFRPSAPADAPVHTEPGVQVPVAAAS